MDDLQEKYAKKIAALLRKAESTTPEEAELLLEKAQDLMTRYAIEEAMLHEVAGSVREEIVREYITYKGIYKEALQDIGFRIAAAQDCRCVTSKEGNTVKLHIIGFKGDVDRAIMLDSSVQIQAAAAIAKWQRDGGIAEWMSGGQKYRARREFYYGFSSGLNERLTVAKKAGTEGYVRDNSPSLGADAEVRSSMELVLRSRKDQVNDWVDGEYGRLRRGRARQTMYGGHDAADAGRSAGRNANTGHSGALRNRPGLNA